jgi:hypothetical protein
MSGHSAGVGFVGIQRTDIHKKFKIQNKNTGFKAYIKGKLNFDQLIARVGEYQCDLSMTKS